MRQIESDIVRQTHFILLDGKTQLWNCLKKLTFWALELHDGRPGLRLNDGSDVKL